MNYRYILQLARYPTIVRIRYSTGYPASQMRYPAGYQILKKDRFIRLDARCFR
jgi:hypothetical protein